MPYPEFLKASPFAMAKRYAIRECRGEATASEVTWLHEHPIIWVRALMRIHLDVKDHIAKSKIELEASKPKAGTNAGQLYLNLRKEWMIKRTSRLHFQGILENKIEEVKAIVGSDHFAARITVGDLVMLLLEFIELVDDDEVHVVQAKAEYWVRRLTEG